MLMGSNMEFLFDKEANLKERIRFVHTYAQWVKRMSNTVWSTEQARLIDSFMENAKNFRLSPQEYLRLIEIGRTAR